MQLSIFINELDVSRYALLEKTEIKKELSGRVSTARVSFKITKQEAARYGFARYGLDVYTNGVDTFNVDVNPYSTIAIKDQLGNVVFAGYITDIDSEPLTLGLMKYHCTCESYAVLLDSTIVNATYTNQSDRAIIQLAATSVLAGTGVTALTENLSIIQNNIGSFEAKDLSYRELLDRLCELTGGEWFIDDAKNLHYRMTLEQPAVFNFSYVPDNITTFSCSELKIKRSFKNVANYVKVLGGVGSGGAEISYVEEDASSQTVYGIRKTVVVDRSITDYATLGLRAMVELARRAYPSVSGSLVTYRDGLDIGQYIEITDSTFGFYREKFVIRSLKMTAQDQTTTRYEVEFGDYQPTLPFLLRMFQRATKEKTTIQSSVPPSGSVTNSMLAGSITGDKLLNGTITAAQIADGTINAAKITDASITAAQIQNLSITAAQIADLTINGAKIAGNAIANSHIQDGVVTGTKLVNGTITALQIANATITGTQISNSTITALQIANATITGSKIANGTITGTNIAVGTITGTNIASGSISGNHIGYATISGVNIGSATIAGSNIESLTITGDNIANATITSAKIQNLSVDKLTAGTATFTGAVTFQSGTGSVTIASGTVTLSNGTSSVSMSGSHVNISGSLVADVARITDIQVKDSSGFSTGYFYSSGMASYLVANVVQGAFRTMSGTVGVSGTFTTANGKTVTVDSGIITAIV